MECLSTREAYGRYLAEIGEEIPQIVVLDADLSCSTYTCFFAQKFPQRFFNMGIAEQSLINTAAGLAAYGKIPFASSFAIFASGRAWEAIRNTVAFPRLNVKIVVTHGGLTVGGDGASHQSLEDIALMRSIPHMTVVVPADGIETKKVIRAAIQQTGPFYIRLSRLKKPYVSNEETPCMLGKGIVLKEGRDITIAACGVMVAEALDAAQRLSAQGIDAEVINFHTIKPFDEELLLRSLRKTKKIITAEEHSIIGGFGSAVAEIIAEQYPVPLKRIGTRDVFGQSGDPDELMAAYHIKSQDIMLAAQEMCGASAK